MPTLIIVQVGLERAVHDLVKNFEESSVNAITRLTASKNVSTDKSIHNELDYVPSTDCHCVPSVYHPDLETVLSM